MKQLQDIITHQGSGVFATDKEWMGITTPHLFASGRPAVYYAKASEDRLRLSDSGINFHLFSECLPDPSRAKKAFRHQVAYAHGAVLSDGMVLNVTVPIVDAELGISQMLTTLARLASYQPKDAHEQNIDDLLQRMEGYLKMHYGEVIRHPKVIGRSGAEHDFEFQAGLTLVDYAQPKSRQTGRLLRKYADIMPIMPEARFQVFLEDDDPAFHKEAGILSTFYQVTPVSRFLSHVVQ